MASLPYVTAPGNVTKALNAIADAATPQRVSQDFVKEILLIPGGSGDQITSFLKKIGMANTDGTPTDLYKKFRNSGTRKQAAAEILKYGYSELYKRNEYAHQISDAKLKGMIVEITGHEANAKAVQYTKSCFINIKSFASFEEEKKEDEISIKEMKEDNINIGQPLDPVHKVVEGELEGQRVGLNLGYTINLNLPATSDISVFNAIFKSLRENLLDQDNGK